MTDGIKIEKDAKAYINSLSNEELDSLCNSVVHITNSHGAILMFHHAFAIKDRSNIFVYNYGILYSFDKNEYSAEEIRDIY